MPTKEVTDRQKSAHAVVASIEAHAEAAGKALTREFESVLREREAMPDLTLVLKLFGRLLARDNGALVTADDAHESEKSDDDAPRAKRDEAAAKLREACTHARDGISAVHGDAALKSVRMDSAPPPATDGAALLRWAEGAVAKLGDTKVALPKAKKRGVMLDREVLVEDIAGHLPTLKRALGDVERERRELEGTQAAKNRAVERNDATFAVVAGVTSAVLRAAGMDEQADRVRPSARRPGRTETTEGGDASGTGSGGDGPTG
jgi:hypothetical protein